MTASSQPATIASQERTAASVGDLRAVVVDTVRAVPAAAWDAVTGQELGYSHRWQSVLETELRGYQPFYILIYAGAELIGAAFTMVVPDYLLPKRFPRYIQPLVEWTLRKTTLICITPMNSRLEGLMIKPDWPDPDAAVALALRTFDHITRRSMRLLQIFAATTTNDARILNALTQRGYQPTQVEPYVTLDVTWPTFKDYLQSLPRKRRMDIQRQLNNAQRYGEEPHVKPTFFAALREQMSDNSTIFFARVDGQIGAIAVTLHDDMSISFPFIGQDHTLSRQYGLYFLLHFDAIRYAIERRLPLINMGLTQLDLKRRLGYKPNPRSFIVRSPYRPLDRVLQWAMHRLAPRLIAAVGKQKQGEQAPSPGGAASSGE
jgi:hypothetical protein